jgi:carbamoyl-phosphate synthase large subunit
MQPMLTVLIAGIGGASLGTELLKCLRLAGGYRIIGCDISPTAFGLFEEGMAATHIIDQGNYIESILELCGAEGIDWIVPGGEEPMVLLSAAEDRLLKVGTRLVANSRQVIATFSDKARGFERLAALGIPIPLTHELATDADAGRVDTPCIVKPATGSGGSVLVFFAADPGEVAIYADYIRRTGGRPIAQEYIGVEEGEFTIGILSLPDATVVGSIALRRSLDSKLSVAMRGRGGVVSSGYSQGYVGDFPDLRRQAEAIARAIDSRGPINVQGRVRDGVLIPFEINPRLSASSYLRAMAGFNEVDYYLRAVALGESPPRPTIRPGWYLRSLTERYVPPEGISA